MNDLFEYFQDQFCEKDVDYSRIGRWLLQAQQSLSGRALVCSNILLRLCFALRDFEEKRASEADVLVLMRQVIRSYARRLLIPSGLWLQLQEYSERFGLRITNDHLPLAIEVMAEPWNSYWLEDTEIIDELHQRRKDDPVIGDGLIYALSQKEFTTYQSLAQKMAVQECLFAAPGSTLLITLPTGAGKSLCAQLPAWLSSYGGQAKGGTTLVVVPTVSLALDQEARSRRIFPQAVGVEYQPSNLTGSTSIEERAAIYKGIEHGTLPILYTSPEALMNSSLYNICLSAAQKGTLAYLVIDEAHLIETWGAGFRTEFQFLAAYRKQLLKASHGQLKTVLLSATVTESCEKLLVRLFSENSQTFGSIRADRLRPEISYWFNLSENDAMREKRILDALCHLPRPAIVYVTSPEDTRRWLHILKSHHFRRCAAFSGDTSSDNRLRLMKGWNENNYDIMVATSAFGVGVDKSDIRTVVHACLPENVDRFYQEVGRGGRDGFSSISLMCLTKGDFVSAQQMNRSARITLPKAISRWKGMYTTKYLHPSRPDVLFLDTNAPPFDKQEMYQGPSNKEWNEHTLLLMQRAGLIKITELCDEALPLEKQLDTDVSEQVVEEETSKAWLQVEVLQPHITDHPDNIEFKEMLEKTRQEEVDDIKSKLQKMQELFQTYAALSPKHCIARLFRDVYKRCTLACGGCPGCRSQNQLPYFSTLDIEREGRRLLWPSLPFRTDSLPPLGILERIHIVFDEPSALQIEAVLVRLLQVGVQQFILPEELLQDRQWCDHLIASFGKDRVEPHIILEESWLNSSDEYPFYMVPTAIIYPFQDRRADRLHRTLRSLEYRSSFPFPVISIVQRSLFLQSEGGLFVEKVNGISYMPELFLENLGDEEDIIL